jgi:hypothetical protein
LQWKALFSATVRRLLSPLGAAAQLNPFAEYGRTPVRRSRLRARRAAQRSPRHEKMT